MLSPFYSVESGHSNLSMCCTTLLSFIPFYPYFVPVIPSLVYFPKPLYSNYRQFWLSRTNLYHFSGKGRFNIPDQRDYQHHWSPTTLAVPIKLCDNSGRIYALLGSSFVATEATGCGTSLTTGERIYVRVTLMWVTTFCGERRKMADLLSLHSGGRVIIRLLP